MLCSHVGAARKSLVEIKEKILIIAYGLQKEEKSRRRAQHKAFEGEFLRVHFIGRRENRKKEEYDGDDSFGEKTRKLAFFYAYFPASSSSNHRVVLGVSTSQDMPPFRFFIKALTRAFNMVRPLKMPHYA